jgi:hypothetical protein
MLRRGAQSALFALLMAFACAQAPAQSTPAPPQAGAPPTPAAGQQATPGAAQGDAAAQPQPATGPAVGVDRIDAGTEIHAVLDTPLSVRTSKTGDRFTATISDAAHGNGGSVVVPAGARIEGEVAEAEDDKVMAALRGKGALSLRFRNIVLPGGETLPLTANLISVHDLRGRNLGKTDAEGRVQSNVQSREAGIATPAGTAGGSVFGSPIKGLAIGALAGGGYILSTKGKDVSLPAQTGLIIRLDQPISWNGTAPQQQR